MSSRLTASQKEAVETFRSITNTTPSVAEEYLKKKKWQVDQAIDEYYTQTGGSMAVQSTKANEELFNKYKAIGIKEGGDPELDAIQGDGIIALTTDLGIDPLAVEALILCWKLKAKAQFQISREEWTSGLSDLKVEGLNQIKSKVPSWKSELNNAYNFKSFYNWVFEYNKAKEARSIPNEIAIELWKVVMGNRYKHMNIWLEFIKQYNKAISRDTWQQFYDYSTQINDTFSNFDAESAWPVILDEFTEFAKKKVGK